MSEQYPGGYLTKSPVVPTSSSAPGLWNLSQQAQYKAAGTWPSVNIPDAQFNYVTMLLHGDGTNGAQNNQFLDSSSNAFSITPSGNTTQGSFSPYGSNWSNYFDGSSDSVSAPSNATLALSSGDFAVEWWMFPLDDGTSSGRVIVSQETTGGMFWYILSGSLTIRIYAVSTPITYALTNYIGRWTHIAVTRESGTLRLFVNGALVSSASNVYTYAQAGTYIGGSPAQALWFNGYLSNFRIVKGNAVYTSAFTPPTAPLGATSGGQNPPTGTQTALLTCQSNRFIDNSSNSFVITKNGDTSVQRFNPFGTSTAYDTATIGGSGYFDGTGDYLSIANNAAFQFGTGDFTVEFWFYNTGTLKGFIAMNGTSGGSWAAVISGGNLYWQTNTATSNLYSNSASSLVANAWNHVAIVRSSGTNKMYFNGSVQATTAADSTNYASTASLYVGLWPGAIGGGSNDYFTGYLSNVRINKGTAIYTGAFTPPTLAPLATSGASSAACYPSTTNVNTSFAASTTSLLTNFTNGAIYDNAMMNDLETVGNAQISTSVKKYGTGSMYFDGSGDSLYIPPSVNNVLNGNFTIEYWINPVNNTGVSGYSMHVASASSGNATYFGVKSATSYVAQLSGGGEWLVTGVPSTGTWTYLAWVRSGTTLTLYVNGTSVGTTTTSATAFSSTYGLNIGQAFGGNEFFLNGYIDDLRITKGYARTITTPTAAFPNYGPT